MLVKRPVTFVTMVSSYFESLTFISLIAGACTPTHDVNKLLCAGICVDDPEYVLILNSNGRSRDCVWLGQKVKRQTRYCGTTNNGKQVSQVCSRTCSSCGSAFSIQLMNTGTNTNFDAAFASAKARWESIIIGDLSDEAARGFDWFGGQLSASYSGAVDDVVIGYEIQVIDGIGGILGSAGPTYRRSSTGSTISGIMRFDQDDFANMSAANAEIIILHEMGKCHWVRVVETFVAYHIIVWLHSLNTFEL